MGYRLTAKAAEDIRRIYVAGARQFGRQQADRYHGLLEQCFRFLADNPLAARVRPGLQPGIRIHPLQSHLVVYRLEDDDHILIVRVRHGLEDWTEEPL